jgi:transposase InsO family protein
MVCSMSRRGNSWDNAPSQSFFNSLKYERVHGMPYATRDEAITDLFAYIEVFLQAESSPLQARLQVADSISARLHYGSA